MYPHKGAFPSMGGGPPTALNNMAMVGETQWLSQSAYQNAQQNIDLDKVDWAQLAQQWIHMKESCGVSVDEPQIQIQAPPPPRISQPIPEYEEKGEAPMEVEHDDEPVAAATVTAVTAPPAPTNIFQSNNWNSESSNANSNSNSNSRGQHQQQHQKPWNRKGNRWNATNSNHSKSQRNSNEAFVSGQVYGNAKQPMPVWSSGAAPAMGANVPPPPPSFANAIAPIHHPPSDLRLQGLDANQKSGIQLEQVGNITATPSLDAAQRKTLPAWIREGLEKMEREKQRQAERDREMKERDEKRRQEKLIEQNLLMQLNANDTSPKLPAKSKFDSDSESDNDETVNSDYSENVPMARMAVGSSARASASSPSVSSSAPVSTTTFKPHRTKAEILTEIMLSVRKNLTEILLEVTNEEIYAIAQDTLSKVRTKGRKAQSVQKNALTAITPGLGLVGYYDSDASKSDDDSDSDNEQDTEQQRASDVDSDTEIMKTIQRRKAAFENKTIEIETYLAESEEKEKQWLEQDDGGRADDTDSVGNSSPAPPSSNSARPIENDETQRDVPKVPTVSKTERKGSRFSDAKALVYNVVANSQLVNTVQPPPAMRQSSLEHRPPAVDPKPLKSSRRDDHSDDSDSSRKHSKYSSSSSRSSHHRSKHDHYHNHSPSSRHHKKSSRRRSSSSSSDRSSYSRHSDRSKHSERSHKRSRRERSSSRSSHGSHKRDKHSHERSYSRSHSYKQGRH